MFFLARRTPFKPKCLHHIMTEPFTRNALFDDRIAAYRRFYDHQWARDLHELSDPSPKLNEILFDLCGTLKGLSNARYIPVLAVDVAKAYVEGFGLTRLDNSQILNVMKHVASAIESRLVLTLSQKAEVKEVIVDLIHEAQEKLAGKKVEFPRDELWNSMVQVCEAGSLDSPKSELWLAIPAAERTWYSALFFAYEDFLVRCISCDRGESIRVGQGFAKLCIESFGLTLANKCWNESVIAIAREVRNALVHAGGRETSNLGKMSHNIKVIDGYLQILPQDVDAVYEAIKPRVASVVEWALTRPAFACATGGSE